MRALIAALTFAIPLPAALAAAPAVPGGAACVMAKWQGNTLDYALVYGEAHPVDAQETAAQLLRQRGTARYGNVDILHPQAWSALPRAHVVVLKTSYRTLRGRTRTSYGCGFAADSHEAALWAAMRDLQTHSWGWKPDRDGYQVVEQLRY